MGAPFRIIPTPTPGQTQQSTHGPVGPESPRRNPPPQTNTDPRPLPFPPVVQPPKPMRVG